MTDGLTNKNITRGFRAPFQNSFQKYTFDDHRTNNGVSGCHTMQIISYRIRTGEKNFNHRAKKDETHRDFNIIYSTRSVILDNLNLSIES